MLKNKLDPETLQTAKHLGITCYIDWILKQVQDDRKNDWIPDYNLRE